MYSTYRIKFWADVDDPDCASHADQPKVARFLAKNPCTGMTRRLATTTVSGKDVAFSETVLHFRDSRTATDYQQLAAGLHADGIADLLHDGYRIPGGPASIPSPDAVNPLQSGRVVRVFEAWYLDGPTPKDDPSLMTMTQDLAPQL